MNLFSISAQSPLTKKFTKHADGTVEKTSYLNAYRVTSHAYKPATLTDFFKIVKQAADDGHCLVKGELTRPLSNESRADSTDSNGTTRWVCLDFDGLPATASVQEILNMCGVGDVDYILQWSASQGITSDALRCHVFMLLAKPVAAPVLKQWLTQLNHQVPFLRDNMKLTKTNMAVTWGLDITACQNDKLIYIAPPILEGIKSPLGRRLRYEHVPRSHRFVTLPEHINTPATNQLLTAARVADLRIAANLPARKNTYKQYKDTEVLSKPDEALISGIKDDREFTYLNLNGGDSWGYYHPTSNPEIIYNFKGEPNYATKELLPDYYKQAKARATRESSAEASVGAFVSGTQQPVLLAFRDRRQGTYHHGSFDPESGQLSLDQAKNEKQVRDFCMQENMPIGDYVPIWDVVFEPAATFRVDVENRTLNVFTPTPYMQNACVKAQAPKSLSVAAPTILKLITHFLAGDQEAIAHFVNWVAYIVQKRERPRTAWVLYGTEGTGKGMFMTKVLRPMFGENQTAFRQGNELSSQFNGYLENKLIVAFDEAHVARMEDAEAIHGKLRNWITEPTVTIRKMHSDGREQVNYAAILLFSNLPDVITLQKKDRRWNIAPWQDEKLELTDNEIDVKLPKEIQGFYNYLLHLPLDEVAARTPLISEGRDRLISTTTNAAEDVADALMSKTANMGFFLDQLPSDGGNVGHRQSSSVLEYKQVLKALIDRTRVGVGGQCKISRDELQTIFEYTVGNVPVTPNKFTKFLAHRHIHTQKIRLGDKAVYGVQVTWKDHQLFTDYVNNHYAQPEEAAPKPARKKAR